MKTSFVFFTFGFFLLVAGLNHARQEPGPGRYWESVMKDEAMPEAIKGLLHQDQASTLDSDNKKKMKHFVMDFDGRHSHIIYHSDPKFEEEDEPYVKDLKDQKQHESDKTKN